MRFTIDGSAARKISELLRESGLRCPIPSLCDVVFEDKDAADLTAIHERVSGLVDESLPEQQAEALRRAVESANTQLWVNVFERSDYANNDLVMIDASEFAVPLALRAWICDATLTFKAERFYLLRRGKRFPSIEALVSSPI
jgi:hypothetical protein